MYVLLYSILEKHEKRGLPPCQDVKLNEVYNAIHIKYKRTKYKLIDTVAFIKLNMSLEIKLLLNP